MKRVLVVGANSYIGKSFAQYISHKNCEIISDEQQDCRNDIIQVDLVGAANGQWRYTSFEGYDTVLHLAGIVHKKEKKKNNQLYYDVNCKLTVEVAKKAKAAGVKQFIFMSSASVYNSKETCITKDTKPNPNTLYGKSKLAAEKALSKLGSDTFNIAIIRPPMVYGEGCKGNYPRLVRLVRITPIFPEYHNKRSMIYINNLAQFIRKLVIEGKSGIFHPQDDEYIDVVEMVRNISQKLNKKMIFTKKFNWLIDILIPRNSIINKMFSDLYIRYDIY